MITPPKITPFLWYGGDAEQAAEFDVSLIPDSRIVDVQRQGDAAFVVSFELAGVSFTAMNGGPGRRHTEAFSIAVTCEDQAEVDRLWAAFTGGGKEVQCGWLVDRFGLSWQIVPKRFFQLMGAGTPEQSHRVMQAAMEEVGQPDDVPFDGQRMIFGGFETILEA
ncbi:VOC family protein [Hyphomonas sp.]|uniref:VOC family protein n=1 Tax=Hyphomonas sp. TaxID=87 RepID=UPI0032ED6B9C